MTSRQSAHRLEHEAGGTSPVAVADAALADFMAEHYDRLVRLARLICRNGADAGDAVQVGLEQAWRGRSGLRDDARLRPWLDRIIVREAVRIDRSRRSWLGRLLSPHSEVAWIEPADPTAGPSPAWSALREAFAGLSPEQRAVVALHLYAGYSIVETAGLLGALAETVRSRLRLAKERLRHELEEGTR